MEFGLCTRELGNGEEDIINPDGEVIAGQNKGDYYVRVNRAWERISPRNEGFRIGTVLNTFMGLREKLDLSSLLRGLMNFISS